MREDFTARDFTSRPALRGVSPNVLVCVVLTSGAVFGMAALAALQHFGLDLGTIHGDLIAGHTAKPRSVVAWWAWWLLPVAAFLVGPASAALTRAVVANWWRMRALRMCTAAAAIVGLAAVGQLRPAPSLFAFTTNAALGLMVVIASTLLATLGAGLLGGVPCVPLRMRVWAERLAPARPDRPLRGFTPFPFVPGPGGGSANAGLALRRFRRWNALAPGSFSFARLGIAGILALVVLAAAAALGGAAVVLHAIAPGTVRQFVAAHLPSVDSGGHVRRVVLALLPVEPRTRVVMPPVALLDAPPPKPVERPEPRQRAITAAATYGPTLAESELTFTKGYARRRAAQLAANMTSPLSIPQLTAAINIKKVRAASLRFTQ